MPSTKAYQAHLEAVFGNTWRIVAGSMIAFWCGSFANSYVMAKMKIWSAGRQAVDAHHRLDSGWRSGRFGPVLCHRLLRHLA
jgi:hypothetical protein